MKEIGLAAIAGIRKTGNEDIADRGRPIGIKVMDYWRWAFSDLLGNTERGVFAEFIVATDLGLANATRIIWDAHDLLTADGIKIEVKSSAYIQSWQQRALSKITFNIPKTLAWDYQTNTYEETAKRQADVYVFAVLAHQDQKTIDPLNLEQWDFYILATRVIDERLKDQKTVGLNTILTLGATKAAFGSIGSTIKEVLAKYI